MSGVRQFQEDLEKLAKKLDVSVGVVTTKIALDALERIVKRTPKKTGRAQASWDIKEGAPSDKIPKKGNQSAPPPPSIEFDGTKSVFITSALNYIKYLEDGSSDQAPAGMIKITLAELEAEAEFIINNN